MKLQTLIFAICLILTAPAWADAARDYQKGEMAYELGNYEESAKWWRKAAEQGYAYAIYALEDR